jgi:hypothetical protein
MPDQDLDLSDFDQWWGNFTSRLGDLASLIGPPTATPLGPGLLGSADEIAAIARALKGQSDPATSITASAAQRQPGGSDALPYHPVPSPHAGHYATLDEAGKAAASDLPRNRGVEYGAFLPQRYVTENIDLGDGFGPQSISHVDGYDYGGLYTSDDPRRVTLGPPPPHLGGWFHSHTWEPGLDQQNQEPSPDDQVEMARLHRQNDPLIETYILGPDGVLRKFWQPGDKGQIVK